MGYFADVVWYDFRFRSKRAERKKKENNNKESRNNKEEIRKKDERRDTERQKKIIKDLRILHFSTMVRRGYGGRSLDYESRRLRLYNLLRIRLHTRRLDWGFCFNRDWRI